MLLCAVGERETGERPESESCVAAGNLEKKTLLHTYMPLKRVEEKKENMQV